MCTDRLARLSIWPISLCIVAIERVEALSSGSRESNLIRCVAVLSTEGIMSIYRDRCHRPIGLQSFGKCSHAVRPHSAIDEME